MTMRMIAHSYDSYDHAVHAVNALEAAGVPHDDISLVSGDNSRAPSADATRGAGFTDAPAVDAGTGTGTGAGTGASLGTLLGGGAGLLAGIGALAIPGIGPVVAAGWLIATLTGAGVGAAAGGLLGSLTGAGVEEADAKTYAEHVGRGGTLVTVRAGDEMAAQVEHILEHGEPQDATAITGAAAVYPTGTTGAYTATTPAGYSSQPEVAGRGVTTGSDVADARLNVVKEDLVVGKRDVEQGGVRVTSRVVETPVEEQVRLREERVTVDRRPINRPLTGAAADAFRDRTLTSYARSEEAVVGKDARIIEEVGLRKDVGERVETVRDTVRETKVDVEQLPGTAAHPAGAASGQPGSLRDNAALRAVDGTLGTNVSGENPSRKV